MKRTYLRLGLLLGLSAMLTGCGKPGGDQGGGGFAVQAVVAPVQRETVQDQVRLVASLAARDMVDLASETDGIVASIPFTEGAAVTNGQILVLLDQDKTRARLEQAEARCELARSDHQRGQELLESDTISKQEFDRLEATRRDSEAALTLAKEELEDSLIRAPFDGVTGERLVSPGHYLTRGSPVTSVVRLAPLDAEFEGPERYLAHLQSGQAITLSTVAYPDKTFTGKVTFISPRVNTETRTVLIKAELPNEELLLRPGMYGQLDLILTERDDALVIPEASVRYEGPEASVVVMNADGVAEFRSVKVGLILPGRVVIEEGLTEGERVVVEGHQKLGPGMPIAISPDSARYGLSPEPMEPPPAP